MGRLRNMQANILGNVEHVQKQTARILQEQERDLLRAFRARLYDVQTELERERARAEDGAAVWIEKNRQLSKELEWAKDMADRLDRHNAALVKENTRLKLQFKTQEDDREYLIRQLVATKKDAARLRVELSAAQADLVDVQDELHTRERELMAATASLSGSAFGPAPVRAGTAAAGAASADAVTAEVQQYKEVLARLKQVLESERRSLKQVRSAYESELASRTELESWLREAVHQSSERIASRRGPTGVAGAGIVGAMDAASAAPTAQAPRLPQHDSPEALALLDKLMEKEASLASLPARVFPASFASPVT